MVAFNFNLSSLFGLFLFVFIFTLHVSGTISSSTAPAANNQFSSFFASFAPSSSVSAQSSSSSSSTSTGPFTAVYCNAGYFLNSTSSKCVGCAAGLYQPQSNTNVTACLPCPTGSVSSFASSNCTNATDCATGQYISRAVRQYCSFGTYQPLSYASNCPSACLQCAAGDFASITGSSACMSCPSGQSSDLGAAYCFNTTISAASQYGIGTTSLYLCVVAVFLLAL